MAAVSCDSDTSSIQPDPDEAKAALLHVATHQERFYVENNTYTFDLSELGFPAAADFVTPAGFYRIDVGTADSNHYTATATYNGTIAAGAII